MNSSDSAIYKETRDISDDITVYFCFWYKANTFSRRRHVCTRSRNAYWLTIVWPTFSLWDKALLQAHHDNEWPVRQTFLQDSKQNRRISIPHSCNVHHEVSAGITEFHTRFNLHKSNYPLTPQCRVRCAVRSLNVFKGNEILKPNRPGQ